MATGKVENASSGGKGKEVRVVYDPKADEEYLKTGPIHRLQPGNGQASLSRVSRRGLEGKHSTSKIGSE